MISFRIEALRKCKCCLLLVYRLWVPMLNSMQRQSQQCGSRNLGFSIVRIDYERSDEGK